MNVPYIPSYLLVELAYYVSDMSAFLALESFQLLRIHDADCDS